MAKKGKRNPGGGKDHTHDPEELDDMKEFGHHLFHDVFDELNSAGLCGDLAAEALKEAVSQQIGNGYMVLHQHDPAIADKWLAETFARAAEEIRHSGVDLSVAVVRKTP